MDWPRSGRNHIRIRRIPLAHHPITTKATVLPNTMRPTTTKATVLPNTMRPTTTRATVLPNTMRPTTTRATVLPNIVRSHALLVCTARHMACRVVWFCAARAVAALTCAACGIAVWSSIYVCSIVH
ncbi:MAG: hypothetical protein K8963_05890 [Proteobacteria bacterium]|nr:hypothetical protein [Pseudomonadota bacterium]